MYHFHSFDSDPLLTFPVAQLSRCYYRYTGGDIVYYPAGLKRVDTDLLLHPERRPGSDHLGGDQQFA